MSKWYMAFDSGSIEEVEVESETAQFLIHGKSRERMKKHTLWYSCFQSREEAKVWAVERARQGLEQTIVRAQGSVDRARETLARAEAL